MLVLGLSFIVFGSQIAFAENKTSKEKVLYQNDSVIKDAVKLEKMAKKLPKDFEGPKFLLKNNHEGKFYYENGKLYRIKTEAPKQIVQKISSMKKNGNVIDKYVADGFVTITVEEKALDQNTIDALGLEGVESTTIDVTSSSSLLTWLNEAWSDSYALKARYTVYYGHIGSYGDLSNLYCFDSSKGEVTYVDTASGVSPTSGECYYSMYGKAYDFSQNPPAYLGTKSYGDTQTVSYPKVGTAYNFTLNPDIYVQNANGAIGTSWTVYGTRSTSVTVSFNP
jgi:hypothetical protein